MPITDNMLEFLEKKDVKTVISCFSKQHALPKELDEQLVIIVDEYQPKERYYELPQSPIKTHDDNANEPDDLNIELTQQDSDKVLETYNIID